MNEFNDRTVVVSVIVPTYNRLELLRQALNSVLQQDWDGWELVVVDDGSSDGTIEYLKSLTPANVRLVLLPHSGNVAHVRNAGAKAATGDYLAFLDSDDLWDPRKLAFQMDRIREDNAPWSYTAYDHIDASGQPVPPRSGGFATASGRITERILSTEVAVGISTLLVSKALFERVGLFDEDPALNLREDYDLALRLSAVAPVVASAETLVHVREHPGRATHACGDSFERMAYVYGKFVAATSNERLKKLARVREAVHLAEAGTARLRHRQPVAALRLWGRALRRGASVRTVLSAVRRACVGANGNARQMVHNG
jgi:glycosyltransferase involved in cell wall biosynthesis